MCGVGVFGIGLVYVCGMCGVDCVGGIGVDGDIGDLVVLCGDCIGVGGGSGCVCGGMW